jgi:hypothetical protein
MTATATQIDRDIALLDAAVQELAAVFYRDYSDYLTRLGQALRQQLLLACYHICTQGHPDRFLKLTYTQRQQLQQTLKALASQVQEDLLACLLQPGVQIATEPDGRSRPAPMEDGRFWGESTATRLRPQDEGFQDEGFQDEGLLGEVGRASEVEPPLPTATTTQPVTPSRLSQWQQDLEQAIAEELRTASHAANRILQQAGIVSKALPEALLDMANQAEGADQGGSVPNVMNLLISEGMGDLSTLQELLTQSNRASTDRASADRASTDRASADWAGVDRPGGERSGADWTGAEPPSAEASNRPKAERLKLDRAKAERLKGDLATLMEGKSQNVVQLLAIRLRLTEIEFADASLTVARAQIRQHLAKLKHLGRDYQKKVREREIAEAQAAWRSSWTDE